MHTINFVMVVEIVIIINQYHNILFQIYVLFIFFSSTIKIIRKRDSLNIWSNKLANILSDKNAREGGGAF